MRSLVQSVVILLCFRLALPNWRKNWKQKERREARFIIVTFHMFYR